MAVILKSSNKNGRHNAGSGKISVPNCLQGMRLETASLLHRWVRIGVELIWYLPSWWGGTGDPRPVLQVGRSVCPVLTSWLYPAPSLVRACLRVWTVRACPTWPWRRQVARLLTGLQDIRGQLQQPSQLENQVGQPSSKQPLH